jgi:hypothetical protein
MPYCRRLQRPCTCGRLATHDHYGNMIEVDAGIVCLSNEEILGMLTLLTEEWRRRCKAGETTSVLVQTH